MAQETDIITKIINANPIKNGDAVVTCPKTGTITNLSREINRVPSIDRVNAKYKDRLTATDTYSS